MSIISANIIYLISNLFRTYVLFKFMSIFFKRKARIEKGFEIFLYVNYFLINSMLNIYFFNPFINLTSNLILYFLLTYIYNGKILTRIVSTVIIYSASMIIESIVYNIFNNFIHDHKSLTMIVSSLLQFTLTLFLERMVGENKIINIKLTHLLMIFCIPICSIIIVSTIFLANYSIGFTIMIVSVLLVMNISNFYLYDIIIKHYSDKYDKALLKQQNDTYINQLKIIRESEENAKMIRHDMKNHVIAIQNMIENGNYAEVNHYMQTIFNNTNNKREYVNSGNVEVDSLLNYKINEAIELGAELKIDINIPSSFSMELFDLVVILGNLLDNSLDAIKKVSEKYLSIDMKFEKSMLFIKVKNTFDGTIINCNDRILTTKNNKDNHGLGLISIENIISKYDGSLDTEYSSNIFSVDIILYISEN